MEYFYTFSMQLGRHERHPGDVPARPSQAWHQTCSDRITRHNNDWNLTSRLLRSHRARSVYSDDNVNLRGDQFLGKGW